LLDTSRTLSPVQKVVGPLAVITGAMMLLWNKALGWRSGTEKGKDEWAWWNDHLEKAVSGEW